ncbi:MAG: sulfatase-like hydrolase/transferase [Bacteroidota bacterium]|nr:sulfatase-like hydrolase/transferase [Bacteroidota bacterium]
MSFKIINQGKISFLLFFTFMSFYGFGQVKNSSLSNHPHQSDNFKKPNIIFILTDDLGYGDLGVFFQNQRRKTNKRNEPWTMTPYLDKMAKEGATLEQYCAAPVCAPSRASLMLGQSQGHANVKDNQFDKALEDNYTLGNVMQEAGYVTDAIGKWGLQGAKEWSKDGDTWPAQPLNRGFDDFYGYMRHKDGHEHYPKEGLYDGHKEVWDNHENVSDKLDKCYTGDLWTAAAKKYIIKHANGVNKDKPFFMYLAYDLPHAVLELPTQAYPKGVGLKGGIQWDGTAGHMINTASGVPDSWRYPVYKNATYDDDNNPATPEVPWPDTYVRYATVVKRIDNMVHDILALLKDLHIDDNTLVIFTSDNGPSDESYLPNNYVKNNPDFFSSFGPFDGIKRDVWEGGVRMPTIAWWPGHIRPGTNIERPSISYDWMPTITAAAGLPGPVRSDGVSLLPELTGKGTQQKSLIYVEYFQNGHTPGYKVFAPSHRNRKRGQMQMLRLGDTVSIRYNIQSPDDDFEVYNIIKDPQQVNDLAKTAKLSGFERYLKGRVLQMRMPESSAPRPYDSLLIPNDKVHNLKHGWKAISYQSATPWISAPGNANKENKFLLSDLHLENNNHNSCVFEGYVLVPENGKYTFRLQANGKAFLRMHDIALIDEDYGYHPGEERSATLNLQKGYHFMRLYFMKETGKENSSIKLQWSKDNNAFEEISKSVYSLK